jgi:hypothetical protein
MNKKHSLIARRPLLSFVAMAALKLPTMLALTGCDWMTEYPHNEEQTDRSDMLKTGTGIYGGTNSTYDTTNPVGHTPATAPNGGNNVGGTSPMNPATGTAPSTTGTADGQSR